MNTRMHDVKSWDRTEHPRRVKVGAELRLQATPVERRLVEVGF